MMCVSKAMQRGGLSGASGRRPHTRAERSRACGGGRETAHALHAEAHSTAAGGGAGRLLVARRVAQ